MVAYDPAFVGAAAAPAAGDCYDPSAPPPPPPRAGDEAAAAAAVISVSSLTKTFGPGLKLGWVEAPPATIARLQKRAYIASGGGMLPLASEIVAFALRDGRQAWAEHLSGLRARCVAAPLLLLLLLRPLRDDHDYDYDYDCYQLTRSPTPLAGTLGGARRSARRSPRPGSRRSSCRPAATLSGCRCPASATRARLR